MNREEYRKFVERLEGHVGDRELANRIAVEIGTTPEVDLEGNIEAEVEGKTYLIPWDVYDPD